MVWTLVTICWNKWLQFNIGNWTPGTCSEGGVRKTAGRVLNLEKISKWMVAAVGGNGKKKAALSEVGWQGCR